MLTGWEDAYRDLTGLAVAGPPRSPRLRRDHVHRVAVRHLDEILPAPFAADFGAEVMQWHREFTNKTKAGARTLRKPLRCPRPQCRLLTLTWTEGDTHVICGNPDCGALIPLAEYEAETARLERGAGARRTRSGSCLNDHAADCFAQASCTRLALMHGVTMPSEPLVLRGPFFVPGGRRASVPDLDVNALLTAKEAAAYAGVSVAAICNWRERGHLPVATDARRQRDPRSSGAGPATGCSDVAKAENAHHERRGEQMAARHHPPRP